MKRDSPRFAEADCQVLEDQLGYQGYGRLQALRLRHRMFSGGWSEALQREFFTTGDSCAVLPYDPAADAVVLVEQFRTGALQRDTTPWTLETPAGMNAPQEDPQQVVRRELYEETGCTPQALEHIGRFFLSPGVCAERMDLYCARVDAAQARRHGGAHHEGEDIRTHVVPRDALGEHLAAQPTSAATLVAVHWLMVHHERLRRVWG